MNAMLKLGPFTISWRPPQVREGSRSLPLTPKQFKVLTLLVKARGKTVAKEAFFAQVWNGGYVEDGNLSQTIFLLRRALGRLPDGRTPIETVPGKGYRLTAGLLEIREGKSTWKLPNGSSDVDAAALGKGDQFRLLVDSIEDYAIYMLDCGGRVRTWNRGAEHIKGYTLDEVLGQHYSLFFVPEEIAARMPERELATAATRGRFSGEGWRLRRNGERFWASVVLTAIRGENGKLLGFAKVVRDLSDRKRYEDALLRIEAVLRRERDRLHAAAESSMDALFICEAVRGNNGDIEDFIFTYLNSNVEKMVSIPRDILLNGKMCELLPVNRTLGLFEAYKNVVVTGEPFIAEVRVHAKDVTSEWVKLRAVRLEDGIAVTVSDITDRKRAETGDAA
jgi:PAS domain S-box-containing protein